MPDFADSLARPLSEKLGERPSALDFIPSAIHSSIRGSSGSTDCTGWIQDALDSMAAAGGGVMYLPWGTYPVLDLDIPSNVYLQGDGFGGTILKRAGTLPAGRGVLNFSGQRSGVSGIAIDGQVTTPTGMDYSAMTDPMADSMTRNTSIRIHSGASDVEIRAIRIFHTGGYAILLDADTGYIRRVNIADSTFDNNRPHLAGLSAGSHLYGHWTGGIHYHTNGTGGNNFGVQALHIRGCHFRRGTGNQVWGHLYGFGTLHSDIRVNNCSFEDIGRDGVLFGGVTGGDCSGNTFRRIGYVCTDDVSPGVPRWINGQWAVGLDTAGLVRGVPYRGNTFISCYGAAMDLDGYADGVVSDNVVRVPKIGEPEYTEDSIASWAGNYCYGMQTSNSNNLADAAYGVMVTRNRIVNCGLGAIRMYAARKCTVYENNIEHPADASTAPIILGNIGAGGSNQRAYDNTVSGNDIHWSPSSGAGCIQEDASLAAFQATDKNWIVDNKVWGTNVWEFTKAAISASVTARVSASNKAALSSSSVNSWQREDGYYRLYRNADVFLTLIDQFNLAVSGTGGPFLNVSLNAVGGAIGTGSRTSSAWDDSMLTGKLYGDGFLCLTDSTYLASEANKLGDTYGYIRYNSTSKKFEQSVSVSGGARVWTDLASGGGGVSSLTAGRIPYALSATQLADSDNLLWNNTDRLATIKGVTTTPGLKVETSYIHSDEGFYSPGTSSATFGAPNGGVSVLSATLTRNDGVSSLWFVRNTGDVAYQRNYGIGIDGLGILRFTDETGAAVRMAINMGGTVMVNNTVHDNSGALLQVTGFVSATTGYYTVGNASSAVNAPNGGVTAKWLIGTTSFTLAQDSAANAGLSATGQGRIYFDSTTKKFRASENGGAYVDLLGAGANAVTVTGNQEISGYKYFGSGSTDRIVMYQIMDNQLGIQTMLDSQVDPTTYSYGGGNNALVLQPRAGIVGVGSVNGSFTFNVEGSIRASSVIYTASTDAAAINAALGGVTALSLISVRNDGGAGLTLSRTAATARTYSFLVDANGQYQIYDSTAGAGRLAIATSGAVMIGTATEDTAANGKLQVAGYVNATAGYYSGGTASTTVNVPNGGITALSLISVRNDGSPGLTLSRTTATARTYGLAINASGQYLIYDSTAGASRLAIAPSGAVMIGTTTEDGVAGGHLQVAGYINASVGYYSGGAAYTTVNIPAGGIYSRSGHFEKYIHIAGNSGVPTATSGTSVPANGMFYYDTSLDKFRAYQAGAWVDMIGGSASGTVNTTGNQEVEGWKYFGSSSDRIVMYRVADNQLGIQTMLDAQTDPTTYSYGGTQNMLLLQPRVGVVGIGAIDGSYALNVVGQVRITTNLNVLSAIYVNGNLALDGSRNFTGASINVTGAVQSQATGTNIAFQTAGTTFQVNGNGVVSSAGGINVSGSTVIDTSRNVAGVNITGSGYLAGTSTTSYFDTAYNSAGAPYRLRGAALIDNAGVWVSAGGINMNAGIGATSFNIYGGATGKSGSFTTTDGKTITVTGGVVTSIV